MRVLISETTWTTMALANGIAAAGLLVTRANDGEDILHCAKTSSHDVIVLDADLPDQDAFKLTARLRRRYPRAGIVVAVTSNDLTSVLNALHSGADGVVHAGADIRETIARINAVGLRRAGRASPILEMDGLVIDTALRCARVGGIDLPVTRIEYELLEFLALNSGQVLSKEAIMDQLYFQGDAPDIGIVSVYICTLRTKIAEAGGNPDLIATAWGRGYSIVEASALRAAG